MFDVEGVSVSPGGTATFAPTHQYHLGLWFANPNTPFKLGCEPGGHRADRDPVQRRAGHRRRPGTQHPQFPVNAGPLSHVHR